MLQIEIITYAMGLWREGTSEYPEDWEAMRLWTRVPIEITIIVHISKI